MPYDDTKPNREELTRQFAEFQRLQASVQPMEQVERDALSNVENWSKKLDESELSPHDLDHLYELAIVQLQRLLGIDIAPTDPKFAVHNRNLNASINILLTFLSRQKKPPIDRLPELLKLIDDNEAELRARFGVRAA